MASDLNLRKFLLPSLDRQRSNSLDCIPLHLSVRWPYSEFVKRTEVRDVYLKLTLYDAVYHQFVGRTLSLPKMKESETSGIMKGTECSQDVYLLSTVNNMSIIICVEVVGVCMVAGVPLKRGNEISLGWTVVRIFDHDELTKEYHGFREANVYQGTPRALLLIEEPIEKNPLLRCVTNSLKVNYAVDFHKPLMKVQHLIPKNILLTVDDKIPGIREEVFNGPGRVIDNFAKPKLQRRTPLYLDHLHVIFYPTIEEFDERLLSSLREHLAGVKSDMKLDCTIVERRLKVGVHNGWCYLQPPQIIYLITGHRRLHDDITESRRLERSRSWSPNMKKKISEAAILMHHNRIKLNEIVEDVELTVVFLLEYVISFPHQSSGEKQLAFPDIQNGTIAISVVTWNPFITAAKSELSLQLRGGPLANPGRQLVYKGMHLFESSGELQFRCTWGKKRSASVSTLASGDTSHVSRLSSGDKAVYSAVKERRRSSVRPRESVPISAVHKEKHRQPTHPNISSYDLSSAKTIDESFLTKTNSHEHDVEQFLEEIPSLPGHHLPVFPVFTSTFQGGHSISRAAYARLYAMGLPPILDRRGKAPEIIDPQQPFLFSSQNKEKDILKCNLISFQFLAYSRLPPRGLMHPKTLFFTFQFYHFPLYVTERLSLENTNLELASDPHHSTFALRRSHSDGSSKGCQTGYEIKYCVDPTVTGSADQASIADLLKEMVLHIDVWDGDSMMYIGTTAVGLKHLCRQGREAVQVTYELDIVFMNHKEDDIEEVCVTSNYVTKGRLLFRMANVGYPFFSMERLVPDVICMPIPVSATKAPIATDSIQQIHKDQHIACARSLWDINHGLAKELEDATLVEESLRANEDEKSSSERLRKLARMQVVRAKKDNLELIDSKMKVKNNLVLYLKFLEALREKTKADTIRNLLLHSVSAHLEMHVAVGYSKYFEFQLVNPSREEQLITIEISDHDLRVVVDPEEWREYRKSVKTSKGPLTEEMMFISEKNIGLPQILMKPREKLMIPFRYQSFDASSFVHYEMNLFSETGHRPGSCSFENIHTWPSKLIEVHFRGGKGEILSALYLRVTLQPPIIDQVLRFQHLENSFLKKFIRIIYNTPPKFLMDEDGKKAYIVRVTDPSVLVEVRPRTSDPVDVLLKIACGSATSIRTFFAFIFCDPFESQPMQTWRISVQSLKRVDVSCIQGQTVYHSIVVRGSHVTRLVKYYSSDPEEIHVVPEDSFLLEAGTVHDVQLQITSITVGKRFMYCTMVDTELHQLLDSWMICLKCQPPVVSRSFRIRLPVRGGRGSNKRISYSNPYDQLKTFRLRTDRPDLIRFRESAFIIGAKDTYTIGLIFPPRGSPGTADIMVFIENDDKKIEETFLIKASYV